MSVLNKIYKNRKSNFEIVDFENENASLRYGFEEAIEMVEEMLDDDLEAFDSENVKGKKGKRKGKKINVKRVALAIASGGASEIARKAKMIAKKKGISPKRVALALATGGASEIALRGKKALSKMSPEKKAKMKAKFKAMGKKGLQYAKYSALSPIFMPLLPLKPAMVIMLKKRGIKTNLIEPTAMIAEKFYKNVLKNEPKQNVDEFDENLDYLETLENFSGEQNHFYDQLAKIAVSMIKAIVGFFKKKKADKDSGKELNEDEKDGIAMAEKTAEATSGMSNEQVRTAMKEPDSDNPNEIKNAVDKSDKPDSGSDDDKSGKSSGGNFFANKKMLLLVVAYFVFVKK